MQVKTLCFVLGFVFSLSSHAASTWLLKCQSGLSLLNATESFDQRWALTLLQENKRSLTAKEMAELIGMPDRDFSKGLFKLFEEGLVHLEVLPNGTMEHPVYVAQLLPAGEVRAKEIEQEAAANVVRNSKLVQELFAEMQSGERLPTPKLDWREPIRSSLSARLLTELAYRGLVEKVDGGYRLTESGRTQWAVFKQLQANKMREPTL